MIMVPLDSKNIGISILFQKLVGYLSKLLIDLFWLVVADCVRLTPQALLGEISIAQQQTIFGSSFHVQTLNKLHFAIRSRQFFSVSIHIWRKKRTRSLKSFLFTTYYINFISNMSAFLLQFSEYLCKSQLI